jgi:uncharacterized protein
MEQRVGDWIQTASGRAFWPMDPRPEDVFIEDIAHSLANICRFGGHCREFYSVAQHSVLVARALAPSARLCGLLHDAAESYLADVTRPVKRHLPDLKEHEARIEAAIFTRYGIPHGMLDEVKRIDNAVLAAEAEQIMLSPPLSWSLPELPLSGLRIEPWGPETAKRMFLAMFFDVGGRQPE